MNVPNSICARCHRNFTSASQATYCSIDCETDPNVYKDDIHFYLKKLTDELDCGDSSCFWKKSGGMRTNGGCRCFKGMHTRKATSAAERLIRYLGLIYK